MIEVVTRLLRRRRAEHNASSIDFFFWRPNNGPMNFGDHLSSAIVTKVAADSGCFLDELLDRRARLLALGSILHFARDGDVVWGSGVNGKVPVDMHRFKMLDVRAVRGPRTREFLRAKGITVPEVYGDPGLLVPALLGFRFEGKGTGETIVVPNLHDIPLVSNRNDTVSPLLPWAHVVQRIARAGMVLASSLHGIILAEAFGVPCRYVRFSESEDLFKYDDYMMGTGRGAIEFAGSCEEAMEMGPMAPLQYDVQPLLDAFPLDLWNTRRRPALA